MKVSGIFTAIVIGVVIGAPGRLVIPGRQRIGIWWTILVGIVAALAGTAIAGAFNVADTKGIAWIELAIQIGLTALGVVGVERFTGRR